MALAGALLGAAALIFLVVVNSRLKRLQRQQRVILGNRGETDLIGHIADLDEKVDHLRLALEDLAVSAKDHEVRIDGCLARIGMVRFDAYEDLGGRQSTSVAFLDSRETGVVVTTVVSREFARMYVKMVKDGRPDVPLAPEETEALDQARARGAAPFTVRPRLEQILQERGVTTAEPETGDEDQPDADEEEAALRALERENRRRVRRGLPALDELPPAPSSLGWSAFQLPPRQGNDDGPPEVPDAGEEPVDKDVTAEGPLEPPPASDLELDAADDAWALEWEDAPATRDRRRAAEGDG
jgi:hypothetical protein